jgi:hypothetical protein
MDVETIKLRCINGINKDRAYDSIETCPPGQEFNQIDCDCEQEYPWAQKRKWKYEVWEKKEWENLYTVNPTDCYPTSLLIPAGSSHTLLDSDTIEDISGIRVIQRQTVVDKGTCCPSPTPVVNILTGIVQYRESFPVAPRQNNSLWPGGPVVGGEWVGIKSYTQPLRFCDCCLDRLGQQKTWIYLKLWVDDVMFFDGSAAAPPPEISFG